MTVSSLRHTSRSTVDLGPGKVGHSVQWSFEGFAAAPSFADPTDATSIHTLGPASTSSHLAALSIQTHLPQSVDIVLHDTFEDIFGGSRDDEPRLVLVPSAYAGANAFFMDARMRLIGCFCHDTPPYGLAWSRDGSDPFAGPPRPLRVSSHPAPVGLLPRLMPAGFECALVLRDSTVAAAVSMLKGEADVALCNQKTIEELHLSTRPISVVINMSWNLFLQAPR